MNGRKLSQEQKDRVYELTLLGKRPGEIAEELKVHPLRVSGVVRGFVAQGRIPASGISTDTQAPENAPPPAPLPPPLPPIVPPMVAVAPPPVATPAVVPPSASTPSAAPLAVPPPHNPAGTLGADQRWAQSSSGEGGNYQLPTQTVTFAIYRITPRGEGLEGLVGSQNTSPTDEEIGRAYGFGTYRVVRQIPGRVPEHREVSVSVAFGKTRNPIAAGVRGPLGVPLSPYVAGGPWGRAGSPASDENPDDQRPPGFRRPMYDFDRPQEPGRPQSGDASVAVTLVDKLTGLQEKTLDRMDKQSERGPDTVIKAFYDQQQVVQQQLAREERAREEERRRADDERRRQFEKEQDDRHRRDMDRLKEERQTLLDLENAKINLIKEESRAREALLKQEMTEARAAAKEATAAAENRIAAMTESLETRLSEERESRQREYDLRERALSNEHSLRIDMLKLREETLKTKNADDLAGMLGKLVDGVKDTVAQIVKLKQFETASPEDRAALMAHQGQPDAALPSAGSPTPVSIEPASAPAAPKPAESASASRIPSAINVTQIIRESMKSPVVQLIFSEWASALQAEGDPSMFANTFMEWMKDESPGGTEARKACATFAQIMDIRDWAAMKALVVPALPENLKAAFDLPNAPGFYNTFKLLVCELVRDFFRAYLEQKQADIRARQAAQQPPVVKPAGKNGNGDPAPIESDIKISESSEAAESQVEEEKASEVAADTA